MDTFDKKFNEWLEKKDGVITEAHQSARYSIEVNYRTTFQDVCDSYAKLTLGYVSAAIKQCGYHCKTMFSQKPFRVAVASRNWDDGEWVGIIAYDHETHKFIVVKGTWNRDRKTMSIHNSHITTSNSALELTKDLRKLMDELKRKPLETFKLNPAKLKRGPKGIGINKFKSL